MSTSPEVLSMPGANLELAKMPGHWLLASVGKRVLRPGGVALTRRMLDGLAIGPEDAVVELAPGLGATARLTLARGPASYVGVERDPAAAAVVRRLFESPRQRCLEGTAAETGLPGESATVVYGEAMLTMHTAAQKEAIVREALRVLRPGGRYGIHELGLTSEADDSKKAEVSRDLSRAIHVGARPLSLSEWRGLLEAEGFEVSLEATAPMHLLEVGQLVRDEGLLGAARIFARLAGNPVARGRVLEMRGVFRKHMGVLCSVVLVARKPA